LEGRFWPNNTKNRGYCISPRDVWSHKSICLIRYLL